MPSAPRPEGKRSPEKRGRHLHLVGGQLQCLHCNHTWFTRIARRPVKCPMCQRKNWDEAPAKK